MARIPDEDIERVKHRTDLVALVRSRGVELDKHGSKDWIGRCPFHDDQQKPNFIVSPAKGLFHCMACGAAGNANSVRRAVRRRQLPARLRTVERRRSRRLLGPERAAGQAIQRAAAGNPFQPRRPGRRAHAPGARVLPRAAVEDAGGAGLSARARPLRRGVPAQAGGAGEVPARLRRPDAGLARAVLRPQGRARRSGPGCKSSACSGRAATSTSTARWCCRSSPPPERSARCTAARSRPNCGPARRCTFTCPGRMKASGTPRR